MEFYGILRTLWNINFKKDQNISHLGYNNLNTYACISLVIYFNINK